MAKSTASFLSEENARRLRAELEHNYLKKFKVLFFSTLQLEGFEYGEDYYIIDRIFNGLNIAMFKLNTAVGEESPVAFQGYTPYNYDRYNNPVMVKIENLRNDPHIPTKHLKNNEEVVLWRPMINYYDQLKPIIKTLVDVDMTIRTNLKLHKMPFAITSDNPQLKNAINKILNDVETVVINDDLMLKSAKTDTPYIIDKLVQFKIAEESKALSILGIKGQKIEKAAQMTVDEVNNNSEEINGYKNYLLDTLTKWFELGNKLFGTNYRVKINDTYEDEPEEMIEEIKQDDEQV